MTKRSRYIHEVRPFARERISFWQGAAIFIIGLVVGWFVLGWVLFPATSNDIYPNDLHPSAVNDYLLMTAESYAATGDLRAAAKRLHYWEPEQLSAMLNALAQSVEIEQPADASYLRLLSHDLHLPDVTATAVSKQASTSSRISFLWLLVPLLALVVFIGLVLLAQKLGWLEQNSFDQPTESVAHNEIENESTEKPAPVVATHQSDDVTIEPESISALEPDIMPPMTSDEIEEKLNYDIDGEDALYAEEDADFIDAEIAEFVSDEPAVPLPAERPVEPDFASTESDSAFFPDETSPESLQPVDEQTSPAQMQILRFDGDPAYNTIIAIEDGDVYLGEYGLSAGQTAPNNHNMVLTLEVWLFDKSDTQTTDVALASPVVVNDPDLKSRYVKENVSVLPLQEGQIILLETAELRLEGRVRRVKYGGTTTDGVPVIEEAEIELSGKRK